MHDPCNARDLRGLFSIINQQLFDQSYHISTPILTISVYECNLVLNYEIDVAKRKLDIIGFLLFDDLWDISFFQVKRVRSQITPL